MTSNASRSSRSARNRPSSASRGRCSFVAPTMRTSVRIVSEPPTRWNSPYSMTRRIFSCMRGGNRAELVEHERAAVRLLEAADVRARGARECAGLMAEQLRLEQRLREGGAVDLDQRLFPARRKVMQARGDELFAGAALADHEHGLHELGRARDVLEHGREGRRLANQTDAFRESSRRQRWPRGTNCWSFRRNLSPRPN